MLKSSRQKQSSNNLRDPQSQTNRLMKLYTNNCSNKKLKQIPLSPPFLSDRNSNPYKSLLKHPKRQMNSISSRCLKQNHSLQNVNIQSLKHNKNIYEEGKSCRIIVIHGKEQRQFYLQATSIQNLISFLKKNLSGDFYFESVEKNLSLDFIITQESLNAQFLNGKTIFIRSIKKIKTLSSEGAVSLKNFQIIKPIGSGGFSKVFLCRFKDDGKFYAIKLIDKEVIVKNKKKRIITNQRNIMKMAKHPFIIQMKFSFETDKYLAFVLQYCSGGELFGLIKKNRRINQRTARFYIIEMLLGLGYLHENQIVYRDIKPQNILIAMDGHVKIADLGLAKPNVTSREMAYSFCGSPQYMSPEMILQKGHTFPVDFYCTGALLYQLLTGLPPFYSRNPDQIYQAVLSEELTFPEDVPITDQCKSLISSLMCKDSKHRLGSLHGIKQILAHPWFGKNSYNKFLNKEIQPPLKFQSLDNLSLNTFVDSKGLKQIEKVREEQNSRISFKNVMKDFYYDYRGATKNTDIKQNIHQYNLRNRTDRSKNKATSLNLNKKITRKISNNKLQNTIITYR